MMQYVLEVKYHQSEDILATPMPRLDKNAKFPVGGNGQKVRQKCVVVFYKFSHENIRTIHLKDKCFPQNCKDFPPKAKFPGNKIPKFHIFTMHRPMQTITLGRRCSCCYHEILVISCIFHLGIHGTLCRPVNRKTKAVGIKLWDSIPNISYVVPTSSCWVWPLD